MWFWDSGACKDLSGRGGEGSDGCGKGKMRRTRFRMPVTSSSLSGLGFRACRVADLQFRVQGCIRILSLKREPELEPLKSCILIYTYTYIYIYSHIYIYVNLYICIYENV